MEGRRGEFTDENNNVYNYCQRSCTHVGQNEPGSDASTRDHIVRYKRESFRFLQDMGIIPKSTHCMDCNKSMNCNSSATVDLFKWICPGCRKICPIKQCSPLEGIDCSYDKILGVLWAWCNSEEIDKTALKFGIESKTVMNIFSIAGLAAEKHITKYTSQWNIGGPGVIVLIDTFPETFLSGSRQSNRPILCLAELKGFPLNILFHPLQAELGTQDNTIEVMKMQCQSFIRDFVHPESAVVARRDSFFCSYEDILLNQPQFNVLASDQGLLKHESVGRNLHNILSTIWEEAVYVCMDAQYYPHHLVKSFLFSHMWKNKFNDSAYPSILKEISNMVTEGSCKLQKIIK